MMHAKARVTQDMRATSNTELLLIKDANRRARLNQIKASMVQAHTDLVAIQTTSNTTPAQVIWAIKREAQVLDSILQYIIQLS